MRIASLAMYVTPPELARATAAFWSFVRDGLRHAGLGDTPDALDDATPYDETWQRPDLLLAQTCGYPYIRHLSERVRLVATPVYGHRGCDGHLSCSFIIVNRNAGVASLDDLRGSTAAINGFDSNSGMNLFRASIAPLARNGRFFSSVIETGGHRRSIDAVASGLADVAAIDCVTYGNILRFDPESLQGIRILQETVKGPGLPLITRGDAPDAEILTLRRVLQQAMVDPGMAGIRDALSLKGMAFLSKQDYEPLAALEREAARSGYPVLA